ESKRFDGDQRQLRVRGYSWDGSRFRERSVASGFAFHDWSPTRATRLRHAFNGDRAADGYHARQSRFGYAEG
ncbi:hypothetical protein A2U01_0109816, partial [Trifolium medium]|nr:hypothetical protein [Trifolium medium]